MRRDAIKGFDERDREEGILSRVCDSTGVLPFQNTRLMPSVGTRRSTRVFVPKSVVNIGGSEAEVKVLRSGKRLLPESGLKVAGKYDELAENGEDWFELIENSVVGDGGKKVRVAGRNSAGKNGIRRKQSDLPLWRSFGSDENRFLTRMDSGNADSGCQEQVSPEKDCGLMGKFRNHDNEEKNPIFSGEDKIYGITYSRKRRRIPASSQLGRKATVDRMYGIPFVRKQRRKVSETARRETQVLKGDNSDFSLRIMKKVTLVILVESSSSSSYYFLIFLVSILSWMRCSRVRMFNLAAFLFLESIARVFAEKGIHFFPLHRPEKIDNNRMVCLPHRFSNLEERVVNASLCNDHGPRCLNLFPSGAPPLSGPGISVIFGASHLVPLVSLNFAALPSYFINLHSKMFFSPHCLQTNEHGDIGCEERPNSCESSSEDLIEEWRDLARLCQESSAATGKGISVKEMANSGYSAPKRRKTGHTIDSLKITTRMNTRKGGVRRAPKIRKPPKKRNTGGSTRIPGRSRVDPVAAVVDGVGGRPSVSRATQNGHPADRVIGTSYSENNGIAEAVISKDSGIESGKENLESFSGKLSISGAGEHRILKKLYSSCNVSNARDKALRSCIDEFVDTGADGTGASPDPNVKPKRKGYRERIKEKKRVLVELKQNIDSACCKANILVIKSDRCWRESGAEVMLESSVSNGCWLAVKTGGLTKYSYRAQEMRPSTSNRYTHARMWSGENDWKLEFCDKKDWTVFKELYGECCDRNLQVVPTKVIPVPGVCEVCDYECSPSVPFLRPSMYITMGDDEVCRALMSESANYDMDSDDEDWLTQLNSSYRDSGNDGLDYISVDNFEKIIYTFEKAAYSHPDDVFDEDGATSLCMGLGGKNLIVAVYGYWLRKRKQKRKALVRVFQGPPPKRAQLIEKPFLRKKRSFKRPAVQIKKGKPEGFLEVSADQEAVCRVEEAKRVAGNTLEQAMAKRRKAQLLMQNADLMTYKSVMSLKIAEAVSRTEVFDVDNLFFD